MEPVSIENIQIGDRYRKQLGDLQPLMDSMSVIGLLHPIVLTENLELVAGLRRLEAAKFLSWQEIPAHIIRIDDILRGEADENIVRLDLLPSEKLAISNELWEREQQEAKERKARPGQAREEKFSPQEIGKTRDKVAKAIGWSGPTLEKARYIQASGKQEFIDRLDSGEGIDRIHRELKREERREQTKQPVDHPAVESLVECIDFRQADVEEASVDLIFTDPPYGEDFLDLWPALASFASHVLKPGGYLLSYAGKMYLPGILQVLSEQLEYEWVYAIHEPGPGKKVFPSRVLEAWRPILVFKKSGESDWQHEFVFDHTVSQRAKEFDEWQQHLEQACYYITNLCPPQGFVVDPMAGTGTTGLACLSENRYFKLFDKDEDMCLTMRSRLAEYLRETENGFS